MNQNNELVSFLLVEDDDDHAELTMRAIRKAQVINKIDRVRDGHEALTYLHQEPPYEDRPLPSLVLLDINLPKMTGLEVLERIRNDDRLAKLTVVILSTSGEERDVNAAYELNANSYLKKPVDSEAFRKMITELSFYWGIWNEPPSSSR